ncbi:MAG: hypothetical protein ACRD5L_04190, partial [Bryobacteraceae bacterium]
MRQVQVAVAAIDVVPGGETQQTGGAVDPPGAAFQLEEVADGRLIQQHVALADARRVLSAELF